MDKPRRYPLFGVLALLVVAFFFSASIFFMFTAQIEMFLLTVDLLGFVFGILLLTSGLIWFKQKRDIENTPTSKIRSLAMGNVEITGKVIPVAGSLMKSPVSRKDCVFYRYTVERESGSGKDRRWSTIKNGSERINFLMQDDTGKVLVNPDRAEIDTRDDHEWIYYASNETPANMERFITENNINMKSVLRLKEWFIEPGDTLYVTGNAGGNPFVDEATAQGEAMDIMIQKGDGAFLISDRSEREITSRLALKSMGGTASGIVLITASVGFFLIRMGLF